MATSININPDVTSLKKAFADIRAEAEKTQAAIGTSIDTSEAVDNMKQLQASAEAAKKALEKVGDKTKVDVDVKQADAALVGLKKRIDDLSGTKATVPRKTQAITDEERLHILRKSHSNQEAALKRRLTEQQAKDADRAFKNYSRTHTHLRQFESFGDFLSGGKDKYGGDFDRIRRETMAYVGRRSGIGLSEAGGMGGIQMHRAGRFAGAVGGMVGGMISGGGGMGGMIGGGLGAAAGMIPGAGLILGPLVGALAGSVGRQLDEAMAESISEGVKSANLARAFGETAAGFREVRDASREAAHGMQITYGESAQYAAAYARTAALRSPDGLMNSLRDAYGFGRNLGVGQGAGVSFFAGMRNTGAASDEKSARRVGLSVAEAIQRGGLGPQADEVLNAVQNFAQTATSTALRAPDVGAFADLLASGHNLNLPGLKAGDMASIIGSIDASMRQGGNAGMASQIVSNEAISSLDRSLNVFETKSVLQGGMFSTIGKTFGKDSALRASAQARYDRATREGNTDAAAAAKRDLDRYDALAAGPNANVSTIDATMRQFSNMGGTTDEAIAAMANHLGLSHDQVAAYRAAVDSAGGEGNLRKRISAAGIDLDKVNMNASMTMMGMAGADDRKLREMSSRLLAGKDFQKLDEPQKRALTEAMGRGTEPLRDAILQTLNQVGGPLSDGDRAQQTQTDMRNAMVRIADQLVPATNVMKDGILALVEKLAPDTEFGKQVRAQAAMMKNQASLDARAAADADAGVLPGTGAAHVFRNPRTGKFVGTAGGRMSANAFQDPRSLLYGASPAAIDKVVEGSGTKRVYQMADGSTETRTGGTRAWRSNNPGNIEYGKFAQSMGAVGSDGRFAIFSSYDAGRKAKEALLFEGQNYRNLTLEQAVSRWAPPSENNTGLYQRTMLGAVGGVSRRMGEYSPEERARLLDAMERHEGFRAGKVDITTPMHSLPELAASPESPADRQRASNITVDSKVTITMLDSKGRPTNDFKAEETSRSHKAHPSGTPGAS